MSRIVLSILPFLMCVDIWFPFIVEAYKKKQKPAPIDYKSMPLVDGLVNTTYAIYHLRGPRFIVIKKYNEKLMVTIREYFPKEGQLYPTKTGISFYMDYWDVFMEKLAEISMFIAPHIEDAM